MNIGSDQILALGAAALALCAVLALLARVRAERGSAIARLALIGRAANDVIYEWDVRSNALALSAAATSQLGYDLAKSRIARSWWEERLHPEDAGPVRDALATLLRSRAREWEMDYRFRKADGTFTTVHDHGYIQRSIRPWRKAQRLVGTLVNVDSVSLYDAVTNLAGRALFTDRVERRAVRGAITGQTFAVLVADIDGFKEMSARVGPKRADEVLLELSRRLETHLGEGETVARLGHDQLAFLVTAATSDDAVARAAQIRDSARIPFDDGIRLDLIAGAAVLPIGGSPDLGRQALAALADAKRRKRRVAVYEPGGEKRWDERVKLRDDLAGALERRELVLHYQPIADAKNGRCVALEALVRWEHPERGILDAGELLQVASDIELGPEIDRWVLGEATRAISGLRKARPDLRLAVNVAAGTLDEQLPVSLRGILAAAQLPGDALSIEVREDPALTTGEAAAAIEALRGLGVDIAIDDFGTGYASLLPAPAIPATEVKIDRVFAGRVATDEHATRIVRSAVQRARELGLRVVGEGAEDSATIAQLRALGVDLVQGRGVATPMPLSAVARWLAPGGQIAVLDGVPARAGRPTLIGENEAAIGAAVDISTASWVQAGSTPNEPAQPFGPDPMGWVLPGAGVDTAPAVLAVGAAPLEFTPAPFAPFSLAAEPSFEETRAAAFAAAFVPVDEPVASFVPAWESVAPAAPIERVALPVRRSTYRTLRQRESEKAAALTVVPDHIAEEPVVEIAQPVERDLRIVALESAGERWELRRARENEETDRVDERLVLLREHSISQRLGSIAS